MQNTGMKRLQLVKEMLYYKHRRDMCFHVSFVKQENECEW